MKKAAFTAAIAAILILAPSCAKHSWEETQVLHEGMHKPHGHGDAGHDAHAAPAAGHEEKKAAH
jgi:hypothetical protein